MYLPKYKVTALVYSVFLILLAYGRGGDTGVEQSAPLVAGALSIVLFSKVFAWLGSWGFMESLARDSGTPLNPKVVAFLGWILLLAVGLFILLSDSLGKQSV